MIARANVQLTPHGCVSFLPVLVALLGLVLSGCSVDESATRPKQRLPNLQLSMEIGSGSDMLQVSRKLEKDDEKGARSWIAESGAAHDATLKALQGQDFGPDVDKKYVSEVIAAIQRHKREQALILRALDSGDVSGAKSIANSSIASSLLMVNQSPRADMSPRERELVDKFNAIIRDRKTGR